MSIRSWLAKRKIKKSFRLSAPAGAALDVRMRHFGLVLDKVAASIPSSPSSRALIEEVTGAPIKAEWVRDKTVGDKAPVVLFLHGGGYVWGAPKHFRDTAWRLSQEAGARVLVLDYPLAPKHVYPSQLDCALEAVDYLIGQGVALSDLVLVGDSAGGNLALALAQRLVADGRTPAGLGLVSPWLDLSGSGDSVRTNADSEAMLDPGAIGVAGKIFAGQIAADDPGVSPLFGDMAGLPPTLIQVAHDEILLDDSVRADEKMRAASVAVRLDIWRGVYHDWPQTARLVPEGKKAIRDMARHFKAAWAKAASDERAKAA